MKQRSGCRSRGGKPRSELLLQRARHSSADTLLLLLRHPPSLHGRKAPAAYEAQRDSSPCPGERAKPGASAPGSPVCNLTEHGFSSVPQDTLQYKYNPQGQRRRARHPKPASPRAEMAPDTLMAAPTAADSEARTVQSLLTGCDIPVQAQRSCT